MIEYTDYESRLPHFGPIRSPIRHVQSGRSALSANPSALLSESPGTRTTISAPRSIFWGCLLLRRCRTNFHISSNFSSLEGGLIHVVSRACSSTNFANFVASYNRATSSTTTSHLLPRRNLRSSATAILSLWAYGHRRQVVVLAPQVTTHQVVLTPYYRITTWHQRLVSASKFE